MSLDRRVLEQDMPQYEQNTKAARERRDREALQQYEAEQRELDRQQREAETQQQNEIQVTQEDKRQSIRDKYEKQISEIKEKRAQALKSAYKSVYGEGGTGNRSDYNTKENKISNKYETQIKALEEKQRIETGRADFSIKYPGIAISQSDLRTFENSPSRSLAGIYQNKMEAKQARLEYQQKADVQTARNEARAIRESIANRTDSFVTGYGLESGSERAANIKPTPNVITGKQAVESRRPLINVKTVETIYGGQQIETNPRAFVASLSRQNVDAAGKPTQPVKVQEGSRVVYSFQNVSDVQDPSAVALLEFQSQLKTQSAPNASVYREILKQRGLPETRLAKRIINTYSEKPKKEYKTVAEAYGLKEAKGERGLIKTPEGKTLFNLETGEGSFRIGRLLGYKYSTPVMVSELGKDVQGPPAPIYEIPDAFGNPRKDRSGNTIQLSSQEKAEKLSQRLSEKPSELTVFGLEGQKTLKVVPPKQTREGGLFESSFNKIEKLQSGINKDQPYISSILTQPLELVKIGIATGGFIQNLQEQNIKPYIQETLNLQRTKTPKPISIGQTSDEVLLPIDISKSFENRNLAFKENYPQSVYEYGGKYGFGSLVVGGATYYVGKGVLQAPKNLISKASKISGFIKRTPKQTISVTETGVSFPSKSWDVVKKEKQIGKQPRMKMPNISINKQKEAIPNPYGKERRIPYAISQFSARVSNLGVYARKGVQNVGVGIKQSIIKDNRFQNRTRIESQNQQIPNVSRPVKPEFNFTDKIKTSLDVNRLKTRQRLGEMRDFFYDVPTSKTVSRFGRLERVSTRIGIGVFKARERLEKLPGFPSLKAPKIKIPESKNLRKIKRNIKLGIYESRKTINKTGKNIKNKIPSIPGTPQTIKNFQTNLRIAKFKKKESLLKSKQLVNQIINPEAKPKVIVPFYTKQGLKNLYRIIKDKPLNYKEIFREANRRKDVRTNKNYSPIGKIKGISSRQEFANLLLDDLDLPKTKLGEFPFRSKLRDPFFPSESYDAKLAKLKKNILDIANKAEDIAKREERRFDLKKQLFVSSDIELQIFKEKLNEFTKILEKSRTRLGKYPFKSKIKNPLYSGRFDEARENLIQNIRKLSIKQDKFRELQKSERFSAMFTKAGLGGKEKTVKELIGEGKALENNKQRIKNSLYEMAKTGQIKLSKAFIRKNNGLKIYTGIKVNLPNQIKPIFKIPKSETVKTPVGQLGVNPIKETEVEKMIREAKASKPRNQFYKRIEISKYLPKTPKEWESWKAIGLVTAGGAGALALSSQPQKAEALPYSQLGKLTVREIESGGQVLIYPESKASAITRNVLKGPKIKLIEQSEEKTEPKLNVKMPEILETSFRLSTPQATRIETKSFTTIMPRIDTKIMTSTKQITRTRQQPKYEQAAKLEPIQIRIPKLKTRQIQKIRYAEPEVPKQPSKQAQPSKIKQKTPQLLRFARPQPNKRPPAAILLLPDKEPEKSKRKESKPGEKADFLGNVSEISVGGIFKRSETVYGQKKINRLLKGDIRVVSGKKRATRKGSVKWVEGKKGDMFGFKNEAKKKRKFSIL